MFIKAIKTDIKKKLLIEAHITTAAILILAIFFVYHFIFTYEIMDSFRNRLISLAQTGALMINADEHDQLKTVKDEESVPYNKIKTLLQVIKKANPDIRYIYTMRKTADPNIWEFVVDAEQNSKYLSHIGDTYDVSQLDDMKKSYEAPTADRSFITDKWGTLISGYAPIKNNEGIVVGIVGVDLDVKVVQTHRNEFLIVTIFIFIISFGLASFSAIFRSNRILKPINQIREAVAQVRKGNFEYTLDINTGDQFEEIANAVRETADHLLHYQKELEDNLDISFKNEIILHRRLELERFVSNLSKTFIEGSKIEEQINEALIILGEFAKADRCYLFLLNRDGTTMCNEWCAKDIETQKQQLENLHLTLFPRWIKKLFDDEIICIKNVREIADSALTEKQILEARGVNSVLVLPLRIKGQLAGFVEFDYVKSFLDTNDNSALLSIGLEILSTALEKSLVEKALVQEKKMFSATFNQAAVGIVHASRDGRFLRVNQKFCEIIGYSQQEVLELTFHDITDPDDLEDDLIQLKRLSEGLIDYFSIEKRYLKKNNSLIWVELTVSLVRDMDGAIDYFIGVIEDISLRKFDEERIVHQNRRMKSELELAGKVQQELLPHSFPNTGKLKFSWEFIPSIYVAGDMFNVFQLDDENVGIYILDVKGHGISAALKAINIAYMLKPSSTPKSCIDGKKIGNRIYPPSQTLRYLNERFSLDSSKNFFTIFYGILNTHTLKLTYSIAGHNPPIIIPDNKNIALMERGGPAIGLLSNVNYSDIILELNPGDKVLMYTDGIFEAEDEKCNRFGINDLMELVDNYRNKSVNELTKLTIGEINKNLGNTQNHDDMTIFAFEINKNVLQ